MMGLPPGSANARPRLPPGGAHAIMMPIIIPINIHPIGMRRQGKKVE
jgi:hypothetical protein